MTQVMTRSFSLRPPTRSNGQAVITGPPGVRRWAANAAGLCPQSQGSGPRSARGRQTRLPTVDQIPRNNRSMRAR